MDEKPEPPMIGSRIAGARRATTVGKNADKSGLVPNWVAALVLGSILVIGAGFFRCGSTPAGLMLCKKDKWRLDGTFNANACFSHLMLSQ